MISRFEQFSFAISVINSYIQKIERTEMEKYGLKGAVAQYLVVMNRFKDGITATQLSKICAKDKAAVSRVVSELENKGLIDRIGENDNMYRAKLILTHKGETAAESLCEKACEAVNSVGKDLEDEERKMLYSALAKITANLQKISENGIS